ncbi:MAG: ribbon-helix-helix domain-containing protein [Planctomycetes bacterium]|nr:ribbon-helix-helix domain-containing protein [Planctomycetota bacterium]
MGNATVTIRLDAALRKDLDALCRRLGRTRSEVVREALARQVALLRFERARESLLPRGEAKGVLTDEDVARSLA